ncbi:MAG: hypothetical protein ABJI00_05480 [Paracoccaceae bacterium]
MTGLEQYEKKKLRTLPRKAETSPWFLGSTLILTCLHDISRQAVLRQLLRQLSNIVVEQSLVKLATLSLICTGHNIVFSAF